MTTLTLVKKTSFTVASLATTIFLSICTPARAFMFGTSGIQFDRDTSINFTFEPISRHLPVQLMGSPSSVRKQWLQQHHPTVLRVQTLR